MADQRNQERHPLHVYLEVRDSESGEVVGRIVDLTTRGMRVVTDRLLEVGHESHLLIATDIGDERRDRVMIDARCIWATQDVNPDHYAAGFQFEHVRPRQETMLARVIRNFRFQETI